MDGTAIAADTTETKKTGSNFRRPRNKDLRPREYLTEDEVERLIKAAKSQGKTPHRDATMILLAFRHGLRSAELCDLKWSVIDFNNATIHINRIKGGTPSVHPLSGRELRWLRKLGREHDSSFVFISRFGTPITGDVVRYVVARAGQKAGLPFPIHPHMLRHSCGYKLAADGVDTRAIQHYLGHRSITSTTIYTELAPGRFDKFWKD